MSILRRLRLPWSPEPVVERVPDQMGLEDGLKPVLITGIVDDDGDIQSVIPVGGSIDALPPADTLTEYFNGTLGASATIDSDEIDMTDWENVLIMWTQATARSTTTTLRETETGSDIHVSINRTDNNGIIEVITETGNTNGAFYCVAKNVGGTKFKVRLENAIAASAGNTVISARRFTRRHN